MPTHAEVIEKIAAIKLSKGLKWEQIAEPLGLAPVWVAAALSGQCYLSPEDCSKIADMFELTDDDCKALQTYPFRGNLPTTVPTDPFVYRFHEIMQVYGIAMKDVAQEEFGDGIMSAIDFTIDVEKE
ncbi:MAG: cyanase, partial [Pseudomonadota bacterium]